MLALTPDNNLFEGLKRLRNDIASINEDNSLFFSVYNYFFRRKVIKRLQASKTTFLTLLQTIESDRDLIVTKDFHETTKELLKDTKLLCEVYENPQLSSPSIKNISLEVITLAHKLERTARLRYFSNQPKNETSDFTKAVAALSSTITAENL